MSARVPEPVGRERNPGGKGGPPVALVALSMTACQFAPRWARRSSGVIRRPSRIAAPMIRSACSLVSLSGQRETAARVTDRARAIAACVPPNICVA